MKQMDVGTMGCFLILLRKLDVISAEVFIATWRLVWMKRP